MHEQRACPTPKHSLHAVQVFLQGAAGASPSATCRLPLAAGMIAAPEAPAALPAPQQQQQQALPVVGAPAPHL